MNTENTAKQAQPTLQELVAKLRDEAEILKLMAGEGGELQNIPTGGRPRTVQEAILPAVDRMADMLINASIIMEKLVGMATGNQIIDMTQASEFTITMEQDTTVKQQSLEQAVNGQRRGVLLVSPALLTECPGQVEEVFKRISFNPVTREIEPLSGSYAYSGTSPHFDICEQAGESAPHYSLTVHTDQDGNITNVDVVKV